MLESHRCGCRPSLGLFPQRGLEQSLGPSEPGCSYIKRGQYLRAPVTVVVPIPLRISVNIIIFTSRSWIPQNPLIHQMYQFIQHTPSLVFQKFLCITIVPRTMFGSGDGLISGTKI